MDMEPLEYDDYGSDSILSTSFISFSDEREDIVPHRATTISFGTVEIRTFNRVVGDHPGCKTGPPISIGWEHIDHEAERLEVYEASRKRKAHLRLTATERRNLLQKDFLIPEDEICSAETEVRRHWETRELPNKRQFLTDRKFASGLQSARRKLHRVLSPEGMWSGMLESQIHFLQVAV
mmetsp:Transcript_10828/g.25094  ORF Transcript_10828/g.25094 Transcript_10828/m.25094 type:complete len:179 (+) Transcript_10828:102-638(+)